jgi:uncharacterized short protein YbdD (DUF466 family)
MLSNAPDLQQKTLFENLKKQHPGKYPKSKERIFQQKVKKWNDLYGKGK